MKPRCLETKMYHMRVLLLIALQLAIAKGFNWDIVMGIEKRLDFYYNGTLTHTEDIPSAKDIQYTTYDPVHYRVIFADNKYPTLSISSFDLSTRKIQHLVTTGATTTGGVPVAYDPVTQLLFWTNGYYNIYSFPLNPASSNKAVENHIVTTERYYCFDIAVDSCGGYIYWITEYEIARARFDGSEIESLIEKYVYRRYSLAIDPQTQKMYWIELTYTDYVLSIESADLNGNNRITLYVIKNESNANSLSVSKDFIYWWSKKQDKIWQLRKNPQQHEEPKLFSISHSDFCWKCQYIAANYTIKEQTQCNLNCEPLKSLIPNKSVPESSDVSVHCSHGTAVSGENRCECAHGYTGERCEVSICQNYCVQGACSVSADGQPECRCKTGFSGERCEVSVCHKHCLNSGVCSMNEEDGPVCKCTAGYDGGRCEVSNCKEYCLQGNCSVSTEGKPKCSCNAGYSGERCEFSICKDYCFQGNCSVGTKGQPKCSCYDGYSGERCEVNACHDYCLNSGACSLNEEDEPICECTEGYEGEKCEVAICKDYCLQGNCSVGTEGQPKCSCNVGFSGERCEFNACHEYCSNNGVCSLNEEYEPVCQCTAGYDGKRCDVPAVVMKCIQCFSMLRDMFIPDATPVTLGKEESTCASTVV